MAVDLLPDILNDALVAVEVAWGADLAADPDTWTWTDITTDVRYDNKIAWSVGRGDEASVSQPAQGSMTLDNRAGAYSLGGQASNWPNIRRNTPVRVRIDPDGGGYSVAFLGFADSWKPGWDITGTEAVVELSASGTLRRLQQGTAPVISPFRRAMLARTDVVAYWPCEETKGAVAIESALTDDTPMLIAGSAELPYPKFEESTDFTCSAPLPLLNLTTWRGTVAAYTATGQVQLRFLAACPTDPIADTECIIASLYTAGTAVRWDIAYVNVGTGALKLYVTDSSGARSELTYTAFNVNNTVRWWSLELAQSGSNVSWSLYVIGLGYVGSGGVGGTYSSHTVTRATAVVVAPDGNIADVALGHVTVLNGTSNFFEDLEPFNGYAFELATDRIQRLCDENGVGVDITGTSSQRMGTQRIDTLVNLLRECETTDGGLLYDGLTAGLTYVTGAERVNAAAALTIEATDLSAPPEPVFDDQRTRNIVTATRTSGGQATYEETEGELGTGIAGVYDSTVEVNTAYADDLIDQASRAVALGTVPGYRHPSLSLSLHAAPWMAPSWLDTGLSARIDLAGVSDVVAQHPVGDVPLLLEGYSQELDTRRWDITMACSPYEPWRAGLWAATTGDTDEYVLRADTDGATLASSASSGASSLSVATSSGPLWSTAADDCPFDVEVGGIRVTVTAVSGGSSPQTFTVTGSTVTKALSSGLSVSLWRPLGPGL